MKSTRISTVFVFLLSLTVTSAAYADVVTDLNTAALNVIRADRTSPPVASRALAILHIAIFDAINGIDRRHESYFVRGNVPASTSREAAASAAGHRVLVVLFPNNTRSFDDLHAATLAAISDRPDKVKGISWGEHVATEILALRAGDRSDTMVAPPSGNGAGVWQPTPPAFTPYLLPQWGFVTPFAMPACHPFLPSGPPPLDSAKYIEDLNEVRAFGAASGSLRTSDQSEIALFWADGPGTETPPGHWNSIAKDVGSTLNTLEENARLFALLNMAMADAAICAWDAKYEFNFWRPITAIRSTADPTWSSFIVTPPFPDYVSGHSTFSGAAATVLAMFYGTDEIAFTTGSDFLTGVTRSFPRFSAAAAEAAISRLYGGIHFRFSNEDGLAAGISIGRWTSQNYLQPTRNRARQ